MQDRRLGKGGRHACGSGATRGKSRGGATKARRRGGTAPPSQGGRVPVSAGRSPVRAEDPCACCRAKRPQSCVTEKVFASAARRRPSSRARWPQWKWADGTGQVGKKAHSGMLPHRAGSQRMSEWPEGCLARSCSRPGQVVWASLGDDTG